MKLSSPYRGTTVLPAENRDLSEKISAIVIRLPAKRVGKIANRTTEAAKKWRQAAACADLASAINMARGIPDIKWLIYEEIEKGGTPEGMFSPQLVVKALALLQRLADGDGEHAQAARDVLGGRS
jgi:hypothetical protein